MKDMQVWNGAGGDNLLWPFDPGTLTIRLGKLQRKEKKDKAEKPEKDQKKPETGPDRIELLEKQ